MCTEINNTSAPARRISTNAGGCSYNYVQHRASFSRATSPSLTVCLYLAYILKTIKISGGVKSTWCMKNSRLSTSIRQYRYSTDLNSGWVFLNVLDVYTSTRYSNRYSYSYSMTSSTCALTHPPRVTVRVIAKTRGYP